MTKTRVCSHCDAPHLRCHTVRHRQFGTVYEYRCDSCGHEMRADSLFSLLLWLGITAVVTVSFVGGLISGALAFGGSEFFVGVGFTLFATITAFVIVRNRIRLQQRPLAASARAWAGTVNQQGQPTA